MYTHTHTHIYIYTMEYYSVKKKRKILLFVIPRMDLESIMLIEMSDRENKTQ